MYIFFDSIKPETVHYLFSQAVNILKALGSLNFVENLFLPDYVLWILSIIKMNLKAAHFFFSYFFSQISKSRSLKV